MIFTEREHLLILRSFLQQLSAQSVTHILDAGSGKTSLSEISAYFPAAYIDAVVYPGDERKLQTIRPMQSERLSIKELDLCRNKITTAYDLVVAHLLLGEAAKFGHSFQTLLEQLMSIQARYVVVIDYLEDPDVDIAAIEILCKQRCMTILNKVISNNPHPQAWPTFTGVHNFGYLMQRSESYWR